MKMNNIIMHLGHRVCSRDYEQVHHKNFYHYSSLIQSSSDDIYVKCAGEQDISTKHQPSTPKELESQGGDTQLQFTTKDSTKTEKKRIRPKEILKVNIMCIKMSAKSKSALNFRLQNNLY